MQADQAQAAEDVGRPRSPTSYALDDGVEVRREVHAVYLALRDLDARQVHHQVAVLGGRRLALTRQLTPTQRAFDQLVDKLRLIRPEANHRGRDSRRRWRISALGAREVVDHALDESELLALRELPDPAVEVAVGHRRTAYRDPHSSIE